MGKSADFLVGNLDVVGIFLVADSEVVTAPFGKTVGDVDFNAVCSCENLALLILDCPVDSVVLLVDERNLEVFAGLDILWFPY